MIPFQGELIIVGPTAVQALGDPEVWIAQRRRQKAENEAEFLEWQGLWQQGTLELSKLSTGGGG